ncbi:MAG: hypothetical protein HQK73_07070 [Desulfamplus sp.]|nr:hypothetical protein [Desulfamplus sp.]
MTQTTEKSDRRKRVIDYANNLNSILSAKKKLSILETNIWSNFKELEYLKHSIEQKSKAIEETLTSIESMEPEILEMRNRFLLVEAEKETLETKYKRLLDIQQNLDKKNSEVSKSKANILQLKRDIKTIHEQIPNLERHNEELLAHKEDIKQSFNANIEKLNRLKTEIEAHKNTIRLMEGIKPESIEDDQFRLLLQHDDNVEAYQAEAIDTVKRITDEISAMKSQIVEFASCESELNTRIQSLATKIDELKSERTTDYDKHSLQVEIDELENRHKSLIRIIEKNRQNKERFTSDLSKIREEISIEEEFEKIFFEKFDYLSSRKKEMDEFQNIEQAINALEERISHINIDITGNQYFIEMADMISQDIEALNKSLNLKVETYLLNIHKYTHLLLLRHNFS